MADKIDIRLSERQYSTRAKIRGIPGSPDYFDGRTVAEVEESRRLTKTRPFSLHYKRKARRSGRFVRSNACGMTNG